MPRAEIDIMNIDEITQDERDALLAQSWQHRQPLYNMYAQTLVTDYAPDLWKIHMWGLTTDFWSGDQVNTMMLAVQNMHSYMMTGWETGIRNTFHTLNRTGLTKQQIMEIIMFSNLYAGMRGLGHAYHAAGDMLAVFREPPVPVVYPEGWAPDPEGMRCGLDMSTRSLTDQDRKNIEEWWEMTIGYVPNSYRFGMKYHPEFLKVNRAKWERALKTVPKQFAPYQMLREHTTSGNKDGLREAVLLGKAWGINKHWMVKGIFGSAYYCTGFEGLYAAHDAVDDLLEDME